MQCGGGDVAVPRPDIELKLLRVFRAVIRHGGFAAAQAELNTSLANISLQMKQLEGRLGVRLCERGLRGLRITPQGTLLEQAAEQLLADVERFRIEVTSIAAAAFHELRIGVLEHIVNNEECRLPAAIGRLRETMQGVTARLTMGSAEQLESLLKQGSLDLIISWVPPRSTGLSVEPLFADRFRLYCSRNHPLFAASGPSADPALIATFEQASWSAQDAYAPASSRLAAGPTSMNSNVNGVVCLVLSGSYLAYLPDSLADPWVKRGELRALSQHHADYEISVGMMNCVNPQNAASSVALEALRGALRAAHQIAKADTRSPGSPG